MRIGQKCAECGRPMRPSNTRAADHPGTTVEGTSTMCAPCLRASKEGRTLAEFRSAPPAECEGCGRPMRPRRVRAADAPGTVAHGGKNVCMSCYVARREGRERAAARPWGVLPCRGCERATRPSSTRAGDYPGTIQRLRAGFCWRCTHDGTAEQVLAMAASVTAWRTRLRATT